MAPGTFPADPSEPPQNYTKHGCDWMLASGVPAIIDECSSKSAEIAAGSKCNAETLDLANRELTQKRYEMLMSEIKHDRQVFEIFLQNRQTHAVNVQQVAIQWQKKLSDEARAAVVAWWDKHVTWFSI